MVIVTVSAGAFVLTGCVGRAYQWKIAQQENNNQPLHFLKTAHPKQASLLRGEKDSVAHSSKDLTTNHYGVAIIDQQSPGNWYQQSHFLRPPPFHTWGPPKRHISETFLSQCIECSMRWTLQSIKGSWWRNLIIAMNTATRSYFMCWNCFLSASLSLQHPSALMRWKRVYISKILGSIASRQRRKRERERARLCLQARRSLTASLSLISNITSRFLRQLRL